MKSKIGYTKGELKRFHKRLYKAFAACSKSIGEIGDAFGEAAKILRDDKFYKAICEANKYIEEQRGGLNDGD